MGASRDRAMGEVNRRDLIDSQFSELSSLLPPQPPDIKPKRVDVIAGAVRYIKLLKDANHRLKADLIFARSRAHNTSYSVIHQNLQRINLRMATQPDQSFDEERASYLKHIASLEEEIQGLKQQISQSAYPMDDFIHLRKTTKGSVLDALSFRR